MLAPPMGAPDSTADVTPGAARDPDEPPPVHRLPHPPRARPERGAHGGERGSKNRLPRRLVAHLACLVLPLVLVGPSLLPGRRFLPLTAYGFAPLSFEHPAAAERALDEANLSTPDRLFPVLTDQVVIRERILAGELPTWDPDIGLGIPLFAGTIAGPAYPPNWLAIALPPDRAAGPLAVLTLYLAGLGLWKLCARLGLGPLACAVGALGLQGCGWGVVNLHYNMKVDAALWLPWCLGAIEALRARERGAGAKLALFAALSLLAGFPPIGVFTVAASGLWALGRRTPRALGWLALGVLGAGVQLVPMVEAASQSERQTQAAERMSADALPAATSLGVVVPDFVGAPTEHVFAPHLPIAWLVAPAGEDVRVAEIANPLEWNTFAGAVVALLALCGIVARPRRALGPLVLLVLAFGYAQAWPLVRLVYHVPGLALGQPARALAVAWVAWPWLAAVGADALVAGAGAERARARAALVAAAALLAIAAGAARFGLDPERAAAALERRLAADYEVSVDEVRHYVRPAESVAAFARLRGTAGWTLGFALAALAAGVLAARGGARRAGGALLLVAVGFEGIVTAGPHLVPRVVGDLPLFPPSPAIDAIAQAADGGRVLRCAPGGIGAVEALARPNLLHPYGVRDMTPFLVFTPRRVVELFAAMDPAARYRSGIARVSEAGLLGHRVLDLARVSAILSREPLAHERLAPVLERPDFHVYARAGALGEARVVRSGVASASDAWAIEQVVAMGEPLAETYLAPGVDAWAAPADGWRAPAVTVTRPAPTRLDAVVEGSAGGWLVFHSVWYPGWKATVDGADAEVVRTDHAFRAVRLPAGERVVVRTQFEPLSHRLGALATLAALAALALGAWLGRRGAR